MSSVAYDVKLEKNAALVSAGFHNRTLSQAAYTTDIYFLQLWRLEVQDQGAGRAGSR